MKLTGQLRLAPTGITIITRTIARLTAFGDRTISLMASSSARARGFMASMGDAAIMADVASTVGEAITAEATLDGATMDAVRVSGAAEGLKVADSVAIEAAISAGSTAEVEMASAGIVADSAATVADSTAIVADSTAIMEAVSAAAGAVPTEVAAAIGN
jgi:hypothetical protein